MTLENYISESISSGRNKTKYIEKETVSPENISNMQIDEFVDILGHILDIVPLEPKKGYGYSTKTLANHTPYGDVLYMHNYIKNNFKEGQVVWHHFKDSNDIVVVSLNAHRMGMNKVLSDMYVLHYDTNGWIKYASHFVEVPTKIADNKDGSYLGDSHNTFFSDTMDMLSDCLTKLI